MANNFNTCANCGCTEEEHGSGDEGEICSGCGEECEFIPVEEDEEDDEGES